MLLAVAVPVVLAATAEEEVRRFQAVGGMSSKGVPYACALLAGPAFHGHAQACWNRVRTGQAATHSVI